jgi:hypothetical protein
VKEGRMVFLGLIQMENVLNVSYFIVYKMNISLEQMIVYVKNVKMVIILEIITIHVNHVVIYLNLFQVENVSILLS